MTGEYYTPPAVKPSYDVLETTVRDLRNQLRLAEAEALKFGQRNAVLELENEQLRERLDSLVQAVADETYERHRQKLAFERQIGDLEAALRMQTRRTLEVMYERTGRD